ncbi:hypothetical protein [Collimonas pratensis]|uniref:hypothetical protein n=1 Tax=Collimonas pratensis TaxID=279113 RepID=UPI0012E6F546|nr:hypothetical protein [Collimonas pratensis]NKI71772.1 hypothetical protein [Collimonas pratensis]
MGTAFWIRRFTFVFILAFIVIVCSQLLKGRVLLYSVTESLTWAALSASIFTAARIYQSRRGKHCAICRDTPEMLNEQSGDKQ